jgi:hypothetical protein
MSTKKIKTDYLKIKIIVLLSLLSTIFIGCKTLDDYQNLSISGIYSNNLESYIELKENNEYSIYRFYGINKIGKSFSGISKGDYEYLGNDIIKLNSKRKTNSFGIDSLKLEVHEENNTKFKDHIVFDFSDIIESRSEIDLVDFNISIEVYVNDIKIDKIKINRENKQVKIPYKYEDFSVISFSMSVSLEDCLSKGPYDVNCLFRNEYVSENFDMNYFSIKIPSLKIDDFYYLYLNDEYMVLKNDEIHWNGDVYVKRKYRSDR